MEWGPFIFINKTLIINSNIWIYQDSCIDLPRPSELTFTCMYPKCHAVIEKICPPDFTANCFCARGAMWSYMKRQETQGFQWPISGLLPSSKISIKTLHEMSLTLITKWVWNNQKVVWGPWLYDKAKSTRQAEWDHKEDSTRFLQPTFSGHKWLFCINVPESSHF